MTQYRLSDDGHLSGAVITAGDMAEAIETATDTWQAGSFDVKCLIDVRVAALDDEGEETGEVEFVAVECGEDEPEPCCVDEAGHDWQSPHEVVGGSDSNPGVWSVGGTAIEVKHCCSRCGRYRRETAYGSQRNPGQCDSVEYLPADDDSRAWIG